MDLEGWPRRRALHRHVYIALIRSYLADYGTQGQLASALNLTEAYVSYLLQPLRIHGRNRIGDHWAEAAQADLHDLAEAQKYLKTPSHQRAEQIARSLCSERERREFLLYHVAMARSISEPPPTGGAPIGRGEISQIIDHLFATHAVALNATSPAATREAYEDVWVLATSTVDNLDPASDPCDRAQLLLFLHDAASVLDRNDIGLACARQARLALMSLPASRSNDDRLSWLRTNSVVAEVVSLNNLQLRSDALKLAVLAERSPIGRIAPEIWTRSLLEQQLTAIAALPRIGVYQAESLADRAMFLAADNSISQVRIKGKLVEVYVSHGSNRSLRAAAGTVDDLEGAALSTDSMSPLRRVVILRTLARYFNADRQPERGQSLLLTAKELVRVAHLPHQHAQFGRFVGGVPG